MNNTLYKILDMKAKNSIFKSVVLKTHEGDRHSNVRIEIEAYDDTFLNAYNRKGSDYILAQLENKLTKEEVRNKIAQHFNLKSGFEGALVTLYGEWRHIELYYMHNGVNQYDYYKQAQ